MAKITTTIDGIHGVVKIAIVDGDDKQTMELKWCVFDEDGSTGFLTSFSESPFLVTELAAEHFLRIILSGLIRAFEVKPGDLTIINHMGESISDVQFLPPTFKGNEADITSFASRQQSLLNIYTVYDESNTLNSDVVCMAEDEGVVDDFLSLVQVRASGNFLAVRKPSQ